MQKKSFKERVGEHFREVIQTKSSPASLAAGFAAGSFVGIMPTPGFNVLLGILLVMTFKKMSKFALFGAIAFWNPLVAAPLYLLAYQIGDWIFGAAPVVTYEITFLDQILSFSRRVLLGITLVSVTVSFLSYFIVYYAAKKYRKSRSSSK